MIGCVRGNTSVMIAHMSDRFERPAFLHREVAPGKFPEGAFRSGSFVQVAELKDLPDSVRARARGNFVIKKNKLGPGHPHWTHLFPGDVDFTRNRERRTIPALAREFKRRHETIAKFFKKQFPDAVVPTQIIVGEDEGPEGRGTPRLYEIQAAVHGLTYPKKEDFDSWELYYWGYRPKELPPPEAELERALRSASESYALDIIDAVRDVELRGRIRLEIEEIMERARQFVAETGEIPYDLLKPDNFLVTAEGMRIVDTNMLVKAADDENGFLAERFARSIRFWEEVTGWIAAAEEEVRRAA